MRVVHILVHSIPAGRPAGRRAAPSNLLFAAFLLLAAVLAPGAGGQTIDWAVANGSWNTATNWNPQNVPNAAGETARFPLGGGTYAVTLNTSPTLDAVLLLNPTATLNLSAQTMTALLSPGITNAGILAANSGTSTIYGDMINGAGAIVRVPGGRSLNLHAPSVTNGGQFLINSDGSASNAYLTLGQSAEFIGSGEVVMQSTSSTTDANLDTYAGVVLTNGAGHTIRGTGTIGAELINIGVISGVGTSHGLTLDASPKENQGTMQAPAGGLLIIATGIDQAAIGRILASGGTVRLNTGAVIAGGTLASEAGGAVVCNTSAPSFIDVTNEAEVRILGGVTTAASGSFLMNNGVIRVNSNNTASNATLTLADGIVLQGSGEVAMLVAGSDLDDAGIDAAPSAWCTHATGHTIHGGGVVKVSMTNEGLIRGDQSGRALSLDMPGMLNSGTLMASSGGRLDIICDSLMQSAGGRILADGGDVHLNTPARVMGGRFETASGNTIQTYSGTVSVADVHNTGDWRLRQSTITDLRGTTITNDGTITINEETAGNTYLRAAEPITLSGSGEVVLRCLSASTDANFETVAGVTCTQGPDHTIRGKGRVGAALVNEGTVLGDVGGVGLVLAGEAKVNRALIKAGPSGKLTVESTTITQEGNGRILADDGQILLSGSTIAGGAVTSSGSGFLRSSGASQFSGVTNLGDMRITTGYTLDVAGGFLVNNGVIRVNETGGSGNTYLRALEDVLLSGNGEVVLRTAGLISDANISTGGDAVLTVSADQRIRGEGFVQAHMINHGTIEGDVPGRSLNLGTDGQTNEGLMRAVSGGMLRVYSGTVTNNALIEAADTSTVSVYTGTLVNNADAVARDGATFLVEGGVLENHALARVHSGGRILQTNGTIENGGTLRAEAQGEARIDHGVFRNAGAVEATDAGLFWSDRWADHFVNGVLTGGAWRAIGTGQLRLIGVNVQTLNAEIVLDGPDSRIWSNEGTTDALAGMTAIGSGGVFELRGERAYTRAGVLANAGQVRVGAGSGLTVTGRFRQTLGAAVTSVEGLLSSPDTLRFDAGFLRGNGRIQGTVHNEGTMQPGASVGHLTIEGDYEQIGNGTVAIELGGTAPGASDLLEVTGGARLNGCLSVRTADGYQPQEGDTIEILRFGSRTGSFSQLAICPAPGVCAELVWQPASLIVVLHVLPTTDVEEPETPDTPEIPDDTTQDGGDTTDPGPAQVLPGAFEFGVLGSSPGAVRVVLALPEAADGEVAIFDITGRHVTTLALGPWGAGEHCLRWNGEADTGGRAPQGVYFGRAWIRTESAVLHGMARFLMIR